MNEKNNSPAMGAGTTGTTGTTGTVGTVGTASSGGFSHNTQTVESGLPSQSGRASGAPAFGGSATTVPHSQQPTGAYEARTGYQPPRADVTVVERRQASRPSSAVIIGSAVAGAIAGGVIPFMLSGRKSEESRASIRRGSAGHETRADLGGDLDRNRPDQDRSPRGIR
jgi:hypothetical protein